MRNKTLLIGLIDKRTKTGLGEAFKIVREGMQEAGLDFNVVYIEGGLDQNQIVGKLTLLKIFRTVKTIVEAWWYLVGVKNVYLTISLSLMGFFRDMLIIIPASILKKRIILHVHSGGYGDFYASQSNLFKTIICKTISSADKIIVLGKSLIDQFSFLPYFPNRIEVVYNGLPFEIDLNQSQQKLWRNSSDTLNILYLSNMIPSKGYLLLLEACKILKENNFEKMCCHFCGSFIETIAETRKLSTAEQEQSFFTLVNQWDLANQVVYHGPVSGAKKEQILEKSHLFVLPTKYMWEGQPISIIEALAFGIPIISTNYRSIPEQVIDGYNGYLVDFDDPRQIAEKILFLANNPELYREFSEHAREHFQANFSRESHLQKIIPIITGTER